MTANLPKKTSNHLINQTILSHTQWYFLCLFSTLIKVFVYNNTFFVPHSSRHWCWHELPIIVLWWLEKKIVKDLSKCVKISWKGFHIAKILGGISRNLDSFLWRLESSWRHIFMRKIGKFAIFFFDQTWWNFDQICIEFCYDLIWMCVYILWYFLVTFGHFWLLLVIFWSF